MSSSPADRIPTSPTSPHNLADAPSPQRLPFYARFGRRSKTTSHANQPAFAASTSNLLSPSAGTSPFSSLIRSSSSSQVHLYSPPASASAFQSPSRAFRFPLQTRVTSPNLERIPQGSSSQTHSIMAANSNATGGSGSGSALGRMFRRYSQGPANRSDSQRSTTRDRDSFSMPRNTSSSAIDRDSASPMRPTANATAPASPLARSGSYRAHLPTLSTNDSNTAITNSRNVTSSPSATAGAAPAIYPAAAVAQPQTSADDANVASQNTQAIPENLSTEATPAATGGSARPLNGMHRIRLVPHLEATRSLHFEPIERDLKEGDGGVKVGRFTDRQPSHRDPVAATLAGVVNDATSSGEFGSGAAPSQSTRGQPGARGGAIPISGSHGGGGRIDSSRIAFKSKVVSRGHAEIWCEPNGRFFIRDTKSSSGTFLNHIRLSGPNLESKPFAIKDGDVVQLGVDYQGGTEEIYRCVKMRVELNRGWQREANQFNVNALRQLRALQGSSLSPPATDDKGKGVTAALPTNRQGVSVTDCCICLFSVTVCQALFIAPCSHVFHYKCIRPLLNLHHPGFSCPLCRTFADLDADVEEDEAWQESLLQEAEAAEARLAQGKLPLEVGTPAVELDSPMAAAMPPSLTSVLLNGAASGDAAVPNGTSANANGPTSKPPLNLATSPLLADLQAGPSSTNAALGRGTAASSRRKSDWARPDTAVGSSAGPLAGDETFAVGDGGAETAGLTSDLGDMAVSDRVLGGDAAASLHRAGHFSTDAGSPTRRGTGPIAIGGSERTMHANKATLTSSSLAGPAAIGSPEEGWPGGAVGGFSPSLEEAGTPLNTTFLSTLAEAPHAAATNTSSPSSTRDFPQGRSAPALTSVPATIPAGTSRARRSENGASDGSRKRSSDGAEDVDTAEEDVEASVVGSQRGHASTGGDGKGKARLDVQPDVTVVGDGSGKLPTEVPASAIVGPKSAGPDPAVQDKTSDGKHDSKHTSDEHGRNTESASPPTSPTSESKMARFKRRISEAM